MAAQISTQPTLSDALSTTAVAFDVTDFGRLRVGGEDAIDLLNRLSTNDLEILEVGSGMATVLTTNKGRIIDLLRVFRREGDLLVVTSPGTQQRVADWMDFYTFAEDVEVHDITDETVQWLAVGSASRDTVLRAGHDISDLDENLAHRGLNGDGAVIRVAFGSLDAYELILPRGEDALDPDVTVWDQADLARLRVEQGVPAYPNEMNEDRNPLESNLKPHINFNKGCYIGQEVVARLDTYDRVQRFLCRLVFDEGSTVATGDEVVVGGDLVGEVTTSAHGLALAYLRKRFYEDGAKVDVRSGENMVPATVMDIRPPEYND